MDEKEAPDSVETDQDKQKRSAAERSARIMGVTPELLADFLNKEVPDAMCGFCGKAEYTIPPDPSGKSAAVVTAPVPHSKGVGVWVYMAICPNCGYTALFNAHIVSAKIVGGD